MGNAFVSRGSGIMAKLMDALSEARWRGDIGAREYQWIIDNVVAPASETMYGEPRIASIRSELGECGGKRHQAAS